MFLRYGRSFPLFLALSSILARECLANSLIFFRGHPVFIAVPGWTELDYTEQTSWLLFLEDLDGLEEDRAMEAELEGRSYAYILDPTYRWEAWAAPKGPDGKLDHNRALTGDDLRDFVDRKLFPYLHGFKQRATGPNTIEYKVGEIFGEIKNKIHSGYKPARDHRPH